MFALKYCLRVPIHEFVLNDFDINLDSLEPGRI
jgi:hypothetical protein